jgi:hypothetical protein
VNCGGLVATAGVLSLATLTACGGGSQGGHPGAASPSSARSTPSRTTETPSTVVSHDRWSLSWKQARPATAGINYKPLLQLPLVVGHRSQSVVGVFPNQQLLMAESRLWHGMTAYQDHLVWTSPGHSQRIPEPDVSGPSRGVTRVAADRRGEAWAESSSQVYEEQEWHVFYHPRHGASRLVADSAHAFPGQHEQIPAGANPMALTASQIYWSATDVGKSGSSIAAVIMSAPRAAGTGGARVAIRNAGLPIAVGSDLIYLHTPRQPSAATTAYRIMRLSNGRTTTLAEGHAHTKGSVVDIAANRDYLVWSWGPRTHAAGTVYVLDRHTKSLGTIRLAHDDWATPISVSGHLLAWGSGGSDGEPGEYLVDLRTHAIWRLANSLGNSEAHVAGDTVVWGSQRRGKVVMQVARWTQP